VTFGSSLRRSRKSRFRHVLRGRTSLFPYLVTSLRHCVLRSKSLRLNLFADPHPLTSVRSILYEKVVGREGATSDVQTFGRSDVQTFLSPLDATLPSIPVSVDSKWFPRTLSPLVATPTKNTGVGEGISSQRSDVPTCGRSDGPFVPLQRTHFGATIRKGARFLYDPGKQLRSPRCLRIVSGHRGQLDLGPQRKSCLGPAF
jgi:hypothetical protein